MAKPQYPTWDVRGRPTPKEILYICDGCGACRWHILNDVIYCFNCKGRKGGSKRMRKATTAETAAAKAALKEIL